MKLSDKVSRHGWLAYAVFLAVMVLDQASKAWVLYGIDLPRQAHIDISPIFDLTMVWNRGMSFGIGADQGDTARWGFFVFAVLIATAIGWWAKSANNRVIGICYGLLMGGAIGNAVDRVRFGAVVDFLDFSGLGFPWVFNVADSAITVGAVLLVYEAFWPVLRQRLASARVRGN